MIQKCFLNLVIVYVHITIVKSTEVITFHSQPKNMSVEINGTAQFECVFEGSPSFPTWRINRVEYAIPTAMLPSKHRVDESGSYLTVYNVDNSMKGNTYQCIVSSCFSDIGHLHVLYSKENITSFLTLMTEVMSHSTLSTDRAQQTSVLYQAQTSNTPVATPIIDSKDISKSYPHREDFIQVVVLSSTLPLLCVITIIIVILIGCGLYIKFRYSSKDLQNRAYSPETDLSRNEAYETINVGIRMKPNTAYESVTKF